MFEDGGTHLLGKRERKIDVDAHVTVAAVVLLMNVDDALLNMRCQKLMTVPLSCHRRLTYCSCVAAGCLGVAYLARRLQAT